MSIDNQIIEFFKKANYLPMKQHEIANALGIVDKNERNAFRKKLYELEKKGTIERLRKNRFSLPNHCNKISGIIKFLSKGGGILIPFDKNNEEIFINDKNLGVALPNDKVVVEIFHRSSYVKNNSLKIRTEGKIFKIIERHKIQIVGTLKHSKYNKYVIPDDHLINYKILINEKTDIGLDHKVLIKLDDWIDPYQNITASILKDLGKKFESGVDVSSMLYNEGIEEKFSDNILDEVKKISIDINEEIKKRHDLRKLITFTIDPDTARDFDDAISIERHSDKGWKLGVHIADVSFYVHPDSKIDKEARNRGNSIYLVDRVIMMLPSELTTRICSLTPDQDHLSHSVEMHISDDGELLNFNTFPSIINSKCRLTYNQVQKLIENKEGHKIPKEISVKIKHLYPLVRKIRERRVNSGSLELNTLDVEIKLDSTGDVESISTRSLAKEAYQMIEECMLLANKVVAEILLKSKHPSIFRIHEDPDEEQWSKMAIELDALGIPYLPNTREEINEIFKLIKGKNNEYAILLSILRNLKRAEYSSKCVGHFGLAFDKYTHFTSPIRRYPDLIVHRLLKDVENNNATKFKAKELDDICEHCSNTERKADELERKSIEKKRIDYYANQLKEGKNPPLKGFITSIKKNGFIVEIPETLQRGMVHYSTISYGWLKPNKNNTSVVNENNKIIFTIGKSVEVIISKVDIERRLIDFILCNDIRLKKVNAKKIPNLKTGKLKIKKQSRRKK